MGVHVVYYIRGVHVVIIYSGGPCLSIYIRGSMFYLYIVGAPCLSIYIKGVHVGSYYIRGVRVVYI